MAIIVCPECGKEVSDKAEQCVHCGYPLIVSEPIQEAKLKRFDLCSKLQDKKIRRIAYVICTVVIVLVLLAIVKVVSFNSFNNDEKVALRAVEKYQNMLKDPDSLVLRSNVAVMYTVEDADNKVETHRYVFFTASGNNSYGSPITDTSVFMDGTYICSADDLEYSEIMKLEDESEQKKYLGIAVRFAEWRLYGESCAEEVDEVYESYWVDGKKIAHKIGADAKIK